MRSKEFRLSAERKKLKRRKDMALMLGLQQGLVYERHRTKFAKSLGYVRKGHLSHFVATRPSVKTMDRNRYGKKHLPSPRDRRVAGF